MIPRSPSARSSLLPLLRTTRALPRVPRLHSLQTRSLSDNVEAPSLSSPRIRQPPDSDTVHFPGAVRSKFTNTLSFSSSQSSPAIPTYRILDTNGAFINPEHTAESLNVTPELAVRMYESMVRTSIFDKIMYESQRQGRISFYMVSAGEEAIAVGSAAAMEEGDRVFAQYREQGSLMFRGFGMEEFMNQLFATSKDTGKGRNMPVHYMSEKLGLYPVSSTLATQLPNAVGAAYGLKLDGLRNMVMCYFGEGAASEGDFHAALNISATRSTPVVFICRNNGYAISTPTLEQYRGDGIASRGIGYGIDTVRVDGNDLLAVLEVTRRARRRAVGLEQDEHQEGPVAGDGMRPVLIEAMSYRVSHHSTSDDSFAYRAKRDVEEWQRRDNPISRFRKFMERHEWWNEQKETDLRTSARKEVLKAFDAAEKLKKPPVGSLFSDIYKVPSKDLEEQRLKLKEMFEKYPEEYNLEDFEKGKDGI